MEDVKLRRHGLRRLQEALDPPRLESDLQAEVQRVAIGRKGGILRQRLQQQVLYPQRVHQGNGLARSRRGGDLMSLSDLRQHRFPPHRNITRKPSSATCPAHKGGHDLATTVVRCR